MKHIYINDLVYYSYEGMNCVDYIVSIVKVWVKDDGDAYMKEVKSCQAKFNDSLLHLSGGDVVRLCDVDRIVTRHFKKREVLF